MPSPIALLALTSLPAPAIPGPGLAPRPNPAQHPPSSPATPHHPPNHLPLRPCDPEVRREPVLSLPKGLPNGFDPAARHAVASATEGLPSRDRLRACGGPSSAATRRRRWTGRWSRASTAWRTARRTNRLDPGRQRASRGSQTGRKGPGMIVNVKARYADGVLTPLEPLDLDEGKEVIVSIEDAEAAVKDAPTARQGLAAIAARVSEAARSLGPGIRSTTSTAIPGKRTSGRSLRGLGLLDCVVEPSRCAPPEVDGRCRRLGNIRCRDDATGVG